MKKTLPAKQTTKKIIKTPDVKAASKVPLKTRKSLRVAVADKYVHNGSIWTKPYLQKQQDEFHAAHPNSKVLLAIFIGAMLLFFYVAWSNRVDLFPELFPM